MDAMVGCVRGYISVYVKSQVIGGCRVLSLPVSREEVGLIRLADGSELKLRILVVDVREAGFSPFGGVNFDVKVVGGVSTLSVPEELRKAVDGKPLMPPAPPPDGWEIVDIVEQRPAVVEEVVATSQGKFIVRVVAEAVMVARNMKYRSTLGEPVYWVSWVYKISWKPVVEAGGL